MDHAQSSSVSIILVTHDRTRRAEVTIPRHFTVADLVRASSKKWMLSLSSYQVTNTTTGNVMHLQDRLTESRVSQKDVLMIQPMALHGTGY